MEKIRNVHKTLIRKPEEKRPLDKHTWKDNIKMNLKEIGCEDVDCIHLVRIMSGRGLL
jgi:hypothetical protein